MLPRRMGSTLALTLPAVAAAALVACARTAPPAPVMLGQSVEARPAPLVMAPPRPVPPPPEPAAPPAQVAVIPPSVSLPPPVSLPTREQHVEAAAPPSGSTRRVPAHPDHVTVRRGEGWLLHCGDAYFHHGEVQTPSYCPPGLGVFQELNQVDGAARRQNRERLRELAARHGEEVELICSHDAHALDHRRQPAGDAASSG